MKRIFKYTLNPVNQSSLSLPKGAQLLSIHEQRGAICLWALVDEEEATRETFHFVIYGTGRPFEELTGPFLGSVHLNDGAYVFHVFQKGGA